MINEIFELNGVFYKIPQDKYETREFFLKRVWYILKILKNDQTKQIDLDNLIKLSRLYINVTQLGCAYNEDLMKQL